jgi:fumarate hydratase subunit beta
VLVRSPRRSSPVNEVKSKLEAKSNGEYGLRAISKKITLPLTDEVLKDLKTGDNLSLTGTIYAARDAAHQRIVEALDHGKPLPFDIKGATIYYMGPTPARPGRIIGSAGPTTSGRMDVYAPRLIAAGLKGMIGKGSRLSSVKNAMMKYKAVYLGAIGGAGALISRSIKKAEVIAYEELGAEALHRLEVASFLVTVVNDIYGGDLYEEGKAKYKGKAS